MLIAMTIPLTGTQYEIEAGDYRATVTELGAGLRGLRFGDIFLVTSFDADELPPHGAGQLLTPWPNRVDGGRYAFDGENYQLALSEPALGNAIHGLTRWAPWARAAHEQDEVTLRCLPHGQQGYPFAVQTDVTYRVDAESGLHVTVTATNKGSRPAPWGTGTHPYLTAGTRTIDDCELELPADRWQPVDDRLIPSGPAQDVTGTELRPAHSAQAGRHPARPRVHRPAPGGRRPRLGPADRRRADHGHVDGRGQPLAPGLHQRPARRGAPPGGGRRRADDVPAERVRQRRGPDRLAAQGVRHGPLGSPGSVTAAGQDLRVRPPAPLTPPAPGPGPHGVSMSAGLPVSPHSTSVTRSGCARRNGRAPASPVAASITAGQ